jgi:hypothetical protein
VRVNTEVLAVDGYAGKVAARSLNAGRIEQPVSQELAHQRHVLLVVVEREDVDAFHGALIDVFVELHLERREFVIE